MTSKSDKQTPQRRTCQHCKQPRDCEYGPDPFLCRAFDEVEMVWLCSDCYFIRMNGLHLPGYRDEDEI